MPRSQATVDTRFTATDRMRGPLQRMQQSVRRFGRVATVAVGAAATATLRATVQFAQTGDEIAKMSRELGLGAEALQELRYAADRQGVSTEDLEKSLGALNNRVGKLRQNQGALATMLNRSNPELAEQLKNAEDSEDAFMLMMQALSETENAADRAALAQAAFGRSGQALVRMAEAGTDGLAALREEAREYGNIISDEAAAGSEAFVDGMTNLKNAMQGVRNQALVPLMNNLQPLIQRMADWVAANQDLINQRIQSVFQGIADAGRLIARLWDTGVIPAVLAGVAAFKLITGAVAAYKSVLAFAKAAQLALNAAMTANPVGLIIAGIAALVAVTVLLIKNWDRVKAVALNVWGAITGFVDSAGARIGEVWQSVTVLLIKNWDRVKAVALNVWSAITGFVDSAGARIGEVWQSVTALIGEVWTGIGDRIRGAWQSIIDWIMGAIERVQGVIDNTIGRIQSATEAVRNVGRGIGERIGNVFDGDSSTGLFTRNSAAIEQTSRSETTNRSEVSIDFSNVPAGAAMSQRGRAPGVSLNFGAAGGRL